TREAMIKFQTKENITPINGSFTGNTRVRLNQLLESAKPPSAPLTLFFRDLVFGIRADPDVTRLQEFLRSKGFFTYPESTGNYFTVTQNAVQLYQLDKKIPSHGSVNALTRAYINLDILTGILAEKKDDSTQVKPLPETATSTFYKKIDISGFSGRSKDPLSEHITITNRTRDESIPVTGWEFETSLGTRLAIPTAYNLPGVLDASLGPITLPPGGRLSITIGKQEKYPAFRENICTGYFTEQTKFTPSISKQCPRPDTRDLLYLGDTCIAAIDKVSRCTIPTATHFFAQTSECSNYMIQHLTYAGCVRDNRNNADFYENQWYVWLSRDTEIFRNIHETLILRDVAGKFVDEREY
ncbi:MAG: cell wall lytic activity protein, partial [Parcubacteria group bacterium Gr01-1014_70]